MAAEIARADRPSRLAEELHRLGLPLDASTQMASRLVVQHPLARRVGVRGLARWLRGAGLAESDAVDGAAILVALDALDLGRSFHEVVEELLLTGMAPARARGAAFEAARIHRSAPLPEPDALLPFPLVVGALTTTVFLALVFLHLLLTA